MPIAKRPQRNQDANRPNDDRAADAFIAEAGRREAGGDEKSRKTPVMIRFDGALLKRVDTAARRRGISRSAWIQFTVSRALDQGEG